MQIDLLTCGNTRQQSWLIGASRTRAAGGPFAHVIFPALVVVLRHGNKTVLFDTGYAADANQHLTSLAERIYRALLPITISDDDTAAAQLPALGIDPDDVTHIVVSHLHADHIGGLKDFPNAEFIVGATPETPARHARFGQARHGIFPQFLPTDIAERCRLSETLPPASPPDWLDPVFDAPHTDRPRDVFADGSALLTSLPGHSPGQLGLLLPDRRMWFVADAVWTAAAIHHNQLPPLPVRAFMGLRSESAQTLAGLQRMAAAQPDLLFVPSHDLDAITQARARLSDG